MKDYEKRVIVQYFQQSHALLREIQHHTEAHPDEPLTGELAERVQRLTSDYAVWVSDMCAVVGLDLGRVDWSKPPYLLPVS